MASCRVDGDDRVVRGLVHCCQVALPRVPTPEVRPRVQAVWSTTEGRPLEITLGTGEQASRLAAHVDPILVLLAPLWIVAPTPLTLAAVQIAACALGALPVFWLGQRHLGSEKAAALIALTYLAYPWLAWTTLDACTRSRSRSRCFSSRSGSSTRSASGASHSAPFSSWPRANSWVLFWPALASGTGSRADIAVLAS